MNKNDFDVILDASDKDFTDDLTKALGVKKGDSVTFITPQFERTDGRSVTYYPNTPEEYEALKLMNPENLKKVGCQVWDNKDGKVHWLYPAEWYEHIPDGTEIVGICGKAEAFKKGETGNDMRFGALSYGFLQQRH